VGGGRGFRGGLEKILRGLKRLLGKSAPEPTPPNFYVYARRITPNRVTTSRNELAMPTCVDVEAMANRLERCVRFGRPGI